MAQEKDYSLKVRLTQLMGAFVKDLTGRSPKTLPAPSPTCSTTFFLRPESVISFLARNEQGDRCLYRVSDHLPTPDEVRQWVRETTD